MYLKFLTLFKNVPVSDIRRVYKIVERSILEGRLVNDKYMIERFIRNKDYDRF